MAEWKDIKEKALKVLGDDAQVPDLPAAVNKASADVKKKYGEFEKVRDDIKDKLLAVQNSNAAVRNAVKQFEAKIQKSDFKIDSKNKENVKKIEKAREILGGRLTAAIKDCDDDDAMLDELDKHVVQLGKYEQKAESM